MCMNFSTLKAHQVDLKMSCGPPACPKQPVSGQLRLRHKMLLQYVIPWDIPWHWIRCWTAAWCLHLKRKLNQRNLIKQLIEGSSTAHFKQADIWRNGCLIKIYQLTGETLNNTWMSPLAHSAENKTKIFEPDKIISTWRESGPCDGLAVTAPSRFTDLWLSVKYFQGHIGCC